MAGSEDKEAEILRAWNANANPWAEAVRQGAVESRVTVTNAAILEAVMDCAPATVLDLGCGEGWLCRALAARGVAAVGVDGVAALVAQAQKRGGDFRCYSYGEVAAGRLQLSVDVVVSNFALFGERSVDELTAAIPALLRPGGYWLVQTLHPRTVCGDAPYEDGWRTGSWAGCGPGFGDPAPWYFRTMESWRTLFESHGFTVLDCREPRAAGSRQPLSALFIARRATA